MNIAVNNKNDKEKPNARQADNKGGKKTQATTRRGRGREGALLPELSNWWEGAIVAEEDSLTVVESVCVCERAREGEWDQPSSRGSCLLILLFCFVLLCFDCFDCFRCFVWLLLWRQ